MRLVAELTMPTNNSWNGRWTGENNKYTKSFFNLKSKKDADKYIGNYFYSFGDGWTACVEIRKAEPKERVTNKFCGYEWMLKSILMENKIVAPSR